MSTITTPLVPFFYEGSFLEKKLYNIIQTPVGKPDQDTIAILKVIADKYRLFTDKKTKQKRAKFTGELWQVSYKYLEKVYKCSHQTIRRSLKKLEELGFIERIIKTIVLNGKLIPNALHIKLNISRLYDIFFPTPSLQICIENSSNNNLPPLKGRKDYYRSKDILDRSKDILDSLVAHAREKSESNFSKKSSLEGSDFLKNLSNLEPGLTFTAENTDGGCPTTEVLANKREVPPPSEGENKHRGLDSYLPLTDAECLESAKRAGRDFTPQETNFLLRKISQTDADKDPDKKHNFPSRERVINYVVKLLQNERREPGFLNKVLEEKAQKQEALVNPSAANTFIKEEKMPEMLESAMRISSYNITMNYFNKKDKAIEPLKDESAKGNYTREEGSVTNHTNGIEPGVPPISEGAVERRLVSVFEPGKAPGDMIIRGDILKKLQEALGKFPKYEARFQYLEETKVNEEEKSVLLKMKHRGAAFLMDRDFRDALDSFFQAKGYAYKLLFKQEDGEYGVYYESWWSWKPSEFYP